MPGVAFAAPPMALVPTVSAAIDEAARELGPDVKGAVIAVGTDRGWNAAVVHRVGPHFRVASWIGKAWGSHLTAAAAVRVTW